MRQKQLTKSLSIIFLFFAVFFFLAGCEGPAEQAGKEIDETVEQQRERLKETEAEIEQLRQELAQVKEENQKAEEELAIARQQRQQALEEMQKGLNEEVPVQSPNPQEQTNQIPQESQEQQPQ